MDLPVGNGAVMPAGAQGQRSPTESFLLADSWHAGTSLSEGSGGRLPIVGDAETQCIGEAFARDLGDEALEQTLEYLDFSVPMPSGVFVLVLVLVLVPLRSASSTPGGGRGGRSVTGAAAESICNLADASAH